MYFLHDLYLVIYSNLKHLYFFADNFYNEKCFKLVV